MERELGRQAATEALPRMLNDLSVSFSDVSDERRVLETRVTNGTAFVRYMVCRLSGDTPQTEQWLAVTATQHFDTEGNGYYLGLEPHVVTKTGKHVRGAGFWCPSVDVSTGSTHSYADSGYINISTGVLSPFKMRVFTAMVEVAQATLDRARS
jgi:hypothetical protein